MQKRGILFISVLVRFANSSFMNVEVFFHDSHLEIVLFLLYKRFRRTYFRLLKTGTVLKMRKTKKGTNKKHSISKQPKNWSRLFTYSRAFSRLSFFAHINKNLVRGYRHTRRYLFNVYRVPVFHFYFSRVMCLYQLRILSLIKPTIKLFPSDPQH